MLAYISAEGTKSSVTNTNGNILGGSKEPVDQDTHKRGIETEFDGQGSKFGVRHTLGNDHSSDSHT